MPPLFSLSLAWRISSARLAFGLIASPHALVALYCPLVSLARRGLTLWSATKGAQHGKGQNTGTSTDGLPIRMSELHQPA